MQIERHPTVFIVDDSQAVRERLKDLLTLGAHAQIVGEAATVDRAVTGIKACQPDYVVLDYQLPDGTGLDVLREVRRQSPASCFVVLTNHRGAALRDAFMNAGAQLFLDKSFEFGRLTRLIAEPKPDNQLNTTEVLTRR